MIDCCWTTMMLLFTEVGAICRILRLAFVRFSATHPHSRVTQVVKVLLRFVSNSFASAKTVLPISNLPPCRGDGRIKCCVRAVALNASFGWEHPAAIIQQEASLGKWKSIPTTIR